MDNLRRSGHKPRRPVILAVLVLIGGALSVLLCSWAFRPQSSLRPSGCSSLTELLSQPSEALAPLPIERMNLLCAKGLPGTEDLDISQCESILIAWAERVRSETRRHESRFRRNPGEFEHSEGLFKMLMLTVVLAEDFGVKYAPEKRFDPQASSADDGFFSDARYVFLHGLLGPGRQGTCSSLPVLFVAVGRKLGYPLKLVTTKGHLFVRWEGQGERFNVEATGRGLNRFEDEYYRRWPFEVSAEEVKAEGYLKSLAPTEELAVFLSIRGMCLRDAGRRAESRESFAAAGKLAPECRAYQVLATTTAND